MKAISSPEETTQVQENHFSRTLGPDWIAEAFRIAHEAAPDSELWLNEIFIETDPAKAHALVDLARASLTVVSDDGDGGPDSKRQIQRARPPHPSPGS